MNKNSISPTLNAGFWFALASAGLFAIRPIFVKLVYAQGVDPVTLIAYRMLFSVPVYIGLLCYFLRRPEVRKKLNLIVIIKISVAGLFGYYAASFLDLLGLQYLSAQLARMILYTYPTFVVLLGALLLGQTITLRVVISLLITYAGIAVIFGHDLAEFGSDIITGGLFVLGSAVSFSLYLLFSKSLISQVGSRLFTCIALISASIGIFTHYGISHNFNEAQVNNEALWLIAMIAVFCTIIPTFCTTAAVARIGANSTGIIATTGPAFTSAAAVIILGESFTLYHITGIALTIAGVANLQRS